MKRTFIALFFVGLLALAGAKTAPRCTFANSFTRYLESQGVELLHRGYFTNKLCKQEWSVHGSCCTSKDVVDFDKDQKKHIKELIAKAYTQVETTIKSAESVVDSLKSYFASSTKKRDRSMLSPDQRRITEWKRMQQIRIRERSLKFLVVALNWMKTNKSKFLSSQIPCMKNLQLQRSTTSCYACSPRANVFFTRDALHLHEQSCRGMISHCNKAWKYLIAFLDRVNKFTEIISYLKKNERKYFVTQFTFPSSTNSIHKWADKTNLRQNLLKCTKSKCPFNAAKQICDTFVNMEQPYYLELALRLSPVAAKRKAKYRRPIIPMIEMRRKKYFRPVMRPKIFNGGAKPKPVVKKPETKPTVVSLLETISSSSASTRNAPALQSSPLSCSTQVCIASKTVMTASQCGSITVQCTTPDITFSDDDSE